MIMHSILVAVSGFFGAVADLGSATGFNIQSHADKKWGILVSYLAFSYKFGILPAFLGMKLGGM
jgi:fluoride ion exporter CrcB/FEX